MRTNYTVSLKRIIDEFSLETMFLPDGGLDAVVSTTEINRPGLQMAGYYEYYDEKRIQIFGLSEISFLKRFTEEKARERLHEFFQKKPSAVIRTRLHPLQNLWEIALINPIFPSNPSISI